MVSVVTKPSTVMGMISPEGPAEEPMVVVTTSAGSVM